MCPCVGTQHAGALRVQAQAPQSWTVADDLHGCLGWNLGPLQELQTLFTPEQSSVSGAPRCTGRWKLAREMGVTVEEPPFVVGECFGASHPYSCRQSLTHALWVSPVHSPVPSPVELWWNYTLCCHISLYVISLVHTERPCRKTNKIGIECKSVDKYLLFEINFTYKEEVGVVYNSTEKGFSRNVGLLSRLW